MARYTGPVCRLCRREGQKLFLKGTRCFTEKCAFERRSYPPGQHGMAAARRRKTSEYANQLREKQKLRRIYGLNERPFRNLFEKAARMPGVTGENLLQLLERRLDNVVYRLGFALSRAQARQLVRHGHIVVNGRRVDISSYLVKVGDEIRVHEKSRDLVPVVEALQARARLPKVNWLAVDEATRTGRVLMLPSRADIPVAVQEQLVVELYSK